MKQIIIIFLLTCFFGNAALAQTSIYRGMIDDKDEIEMHVREFDKQVYGYYFHIGQQKLIPLHFRLAGMNVQLFEGDETDGSRYFDGHFVDSLLKGNWKDLNAGATLSYLLRLTRVDTIAKEKEKNSGTYVAKAPGLLKTLRIVYIDNLHFYFHATITSKTCTGYIYGIANALKGVKAIYTDSKCTQLSFTTAGNISTVLEKACSPTMAPPATSPAPTSCKKKNQNQNPKSNSQLSTPHPTFYLFFLNFELVNQIPIPFGQ